MGNAEGSSSVERIVRKKNETVRLSSRGGGDVSWYFQEYNSSELLLISSSDGMNKSGPNFGILSLLFGKDLTFNATEAVSGYYICKEESTGNIRAQYEVEVLVNHVTVPVYNMTTVNTTDIVAAESGGAGPVVVVIGVVAAVAMGIGAIFRRAFTSEERRERRESVYMYD